MSNAWLLFLWAPNDGAPSGYAACHANRVAKMLRAASPPEWQHVVCVTNMPSGLDADIAVVDVDPTLLAAGRRYPKLDLFRRDASTVFGADRLCMVDLDCVVTGDLSALLGRNEPIVVWADPTTSRTPYNSSMVLLQAGAYPQVRERFDVRATEAAVRRSRFFGSDQAWLALTLGLSLPRWSRADGVLSYQSHCRRPDAHRSSRIVFFAGRPKPWEPEVLNERDWVKEAWA